MYTVKQSTTLTIPIFVHDINGDAVLGLTDVSFTKRIKKSASVWAAMTVTVTETENGWYDLALTAVHTNTLGLLSITLTNAGAKQVNLQFRVEAKLTDSLKDISVANIFNEIITGYSTNGTFGKIIKGIAEGWVTAEGSVNDPSATTTSFVTDLTSTVDDFCAQHTIVIIQDGVIKGETSTVLSFNGTTKEIVLEEALTSAPADTTQFIILADHVHSISAIANAVTAAGDIDGYSLEEALKLILATSVGVLAGGATSEITIQAADGSKTRITATVDANGNRSVVVKDAAG